VLLFLFLENELFGIEKWDENYVEMEKNLKEKGNVNHAFKNMDEGIKKHVFCGIYFCRFALFSHIYCLYAILP